MLCCFILVVADYGWFVVNWLCCRQRTQEARAEGIPGGFQNPLVQWSAPTICTILQLIFWALSNLGKHLGMHVLCAWSQKP